MRPVHLPIFIAIFSLPGCGAEPPERSETELQRLSERLDQLQDATQRLETAVRQNSSEQTKAAQGAQVAIRQSQEKMAAGQFETAHDLLLAGIRNDPSSPAVFSAVLEFVKQASKSSDDRVVDLARDFHNRALTLVPYQAIDRIESAHTELAELENVFNSTREAESPVDPFSQVRRALAASQNKEAPAIVRLQCIQRARREFDEASIDLACNSDGIAGPSWTDWKRMKKQLDDAEKPIMAALWREEEVKVKSWIAAAEELMNKSEKPGRTDESTFRESIQLGIKARDQIGIYTDAESAIGSAVHLQRQVDREIETLSRCREWTYNRLALSELQSLNDEKHKSISAFEKLKMLARFDEHRLSQNVMQKYQEQWKTWFDSCSAAEQIEAMKARIFNEYAR